MSAYLGSEIKETETHIPSAATALDRAGWEGPGAEAAVVSQAREPLLDAQIQAQASVTGLLVAQQVHLQHATTCLDELINFSSSANGLDGLDADLSSLFEAIEFLAIDPANAILRRKVMQGARDIAGKFNRASARLNCLRHDLNSSIQNDVALVNQTLDAIADLNQELMETHPSGERAVLLADQREQYLERLAAAVNIAVIRRADAGLNVSIGGVPMVFGPRVLDNLATYPDKNSHLCIQAQNSVRPLKLSGGSIAGKMTVRDGSLTGLHDGLDKLAGQLIGRFNTVYSATARASQCAVVDFFTGTGAANIAVNSKVGDIPPQAVSAATGRKGASSTLQRFGHAYGQTVSKLGTTLAKVSEELGASQVLNQMLANERNNGASGVHIGDQLSYLARYRAARSASSKTQTALNKMPPMQ